MAILLCHEYWLTACWFVCLQLQQRLLLVCEVQRQLKQQTTEYAALTFPSESMRFGHHSSFENSKSVVSWISGRLVFLAWSMRNTSESLEAASAVTKQAAELAGQLLGTSTWKWLLQAAVIGSHSSTVSTRRPKNRSGSWVLSSLDSGDRHSGYTWGFCPYCVHPDQIRKICWVINQHISEVLRFAQIDPISFT